MSANRTVTTLRAAATGFVSGAEVTGEPQPSQKRASAGSSLPQLWQRSARAAPQTMQNRAPSRLVPPQLGQFRAPPSQDEAIPGCLYGSTDVMASL